MNYTNAYYITPDNSTIKVDFDGNTLFVPCVPGNSDFSRIRALVESGELVITPYQQPAPPPVTQVTMRQARLALLNAGLLDEVEAAIGQSARAVQIEWEYATVVDKGSPLVQTLAAELNFSIEQIDTLFQQATVL